MLHVHVERTTLPYNKDLQLFSYKAIPISQLWKLNYRKSNTYISAFKAKHQKYGLDYFRSQLFKATLEICPHVKAKYLYHSFSKLNSRNMPSILLKLNIYISFSKLNSRNMPLILLKLCISFTLYLLNK